MPSHRINPATSTLAKTLDDRRLGRVLDYVEANLGKGITVDDLASAAALSRFHFSRIFKATVGRTPGQFVGQRRLELAKALFAEGQSLTQIAQACGFSSESNFGRSFHRATGVTPSRYRKLVQGQGMSRTFPAGSSTNAAHRDDESARAEHASGSRSPYGFGASNGEVAAIPAGPPNGEQAERRHISHVARSAGRHGNELGTLMPRPRTTLTLEDARRMLQAGEAKATSIGLPYNIAVVDAGGHLIAFSRQDGALIGSIDLAIGKAVTARLFDKTTAYLAALAQPGEPLFGIGQSNGGKVVIFGGGLPVSVCGTIVGAVGASAGTVEQDIAVAEAAAAAVDHA